MAKKKAGKKPGKKATSNVKKSAKGAEISQAKKTAKTAKSVKATDAKKLATEADEGTIVRKKIVIKDKKTEKKKRKAEKAARKAEKKKDKKPFILIRPFVYFGRYLKASWKELRQVRWPNRKATWKMVLAVLIYTAIFMILISLLDLFFTWLSNLVLGS